MKTIHVQRKEQWGTIRYYPVNDTARAMLELMKRQIFTKAELFVLKNELGFNLEIKTNDDDLLE